MLVLSQYHIFESYKTNIYRAWMKLTNFFCQFPNPWTLRVSGMGGYTLKCEKKSKSLHPSVRLTAHLAIECIMGNYCTRWRPCVKGLSLDGGGGRIFLESRRYVSFNKDLSNEPNFNRIHLAGQYL